MAAAMVRYLIFLLEWVRASQPINKLLIQITVIYRPSSFQWRLINTVDGAAPLIPPLTVACRLLPRQLARGRARSLGGFLFHQQWR
jgi:hypothetical protein